MKLHYGWYVCNGMDPLDPTQEYDWEWCKKLFGEPSENGEWFLDYETDLFYFKNEKHALWFELRWAGSQSN